MWLNQSQDSLCFIYLNVVADSPFNKRLYALSRSPSGVPEHLSHTCYPRHTYPNFNLILTYMVVKHLSSYHVLLVGNTIYFMYLDWIYIDFMHFWRELLILFCILKIKKYYYKTYGKIVALKIYVSQ